MGGADSVRDGTASSLRRCISRSSSASSCSISLAFASARSLSASALRAARRSGGGIASGEEWRDSFSIVASLESD